MVVLEEGGLLGAFSPCASHCAGEMIPYCGVALTGAEPRPADALEAPVMSRGVAASCGPGGVSYSLERLPSWLLQNCFLMQVSCFVHFCIWDGGVNRCFSICCERWALFLRPALQQRPPGDGGCWGSLGLGGCQHWPCVAGPELL